MFDKYALRKISRRKITVFSAVILLFFVFLRNGAPYDIDSNSEEEVTFAVGELKTVKAYSLTRVSLIDPSIADIDKIEGDDILLSAKKAGSTGLTIWDRYGERTLQVRVHPTDLDDLQNRLKQLLALYKIDNLVFSQSKEEGKLVLQGEASVTDKAQVDSILAPFSNMIINTIKVTGENPLVQFDVQVLELSKSAQEILGIEWPQALTVSEHISTTPTNFLNVFKLGQFTRDTALIKNTLNYLITQGKAKVLSRPKLVCLSGKSANFNVGGSVPVVTTTTSSGGNVSTNVEYKSYGVSLSVTPVVKEDEIDITISTDVSDIDEGHSVTVSGAKLFAFATRTAATQLYLKDGQTVFLAGIMKNKISTTVSGIPFLKDIPFVGAIFRKKNFSTDETELVISLTPTIIKTPQPPSSIGIATLQKVPPVYVSMPPGTEEESELKPEIITEETIEASSYQEFLPDSLISYARSVQERIASAIAYPEEAKKYRWQGMVRLGLRILYDGSLVDASIKESSGYDIFDENALLAAKKQAPFFAFPTDIAAQELSIDVPVVYKLDLKP